MLYKRVLITGGAGFIGSHLADAIVEKCALLRIVDNFTSGQIENLESIKDRENMEIMKGDLKDEQACKEVVANMDVLLCNAG